MLGCPGGGWGFSWVCRALALLASRGCADAHVGAGPGVVGRQLSPFQMVYKKCHLSEELGLNLSDPP